METCPTRHPSPPLACPICSGQSRASIYKSRLLPFHSSSCSSLFPCLAFLSQIGSWPIPLRSNPLTALILSCPMDNHDAYDLAGSSSALTGPAASANMGHASIDPSPWKCEPCGKSFTQINALNRHLKESTRHRTDGDESDMRHQCSQCPKTCIRAYYLRRHVRDHHPSNITVSPSTATTHQPGPDHEQYCFSENDSHPQSSTVWQAKPDADALRPGAHESIWTTDIMEDPENIAMTERLFQGMTDIIRRSATIRRTWASESLRYHSSEIVQEFVQLWTLTREFLEEWDQGFPYPNGGVHIDADEIRKALLQEYDQLTLVVHKTFGFRQRIGFPIEPI